LFLRWNFLSSFGTNTNRFSAFFDVLWFCDNYFATCEALLGDLILFIFSLVGRICVPLELIVGQFWSAKDEFLGHFEPIKAKSVAAFLSCIDIHTYICCWLPSIFRNPFTLLNIVSK
jgi:hypothetical protein